LDSSLCVSVSCHSLCMYNVYVYTYPVECGEKGETTPPTREQISSVHEDSLSNSGDGHHGL
jgi:hypothetical protein